MEQCFLSSKDKSVRYNTRDLCELACQVKEKKKGSLITFTERNTHYCNSRSLAEMEPAEVLPSGQKVARYISPISCKLKFFELCDIATPISQNQTNDKRAITTISTTRINIHRKPSHESQTKNIISSEYLCYGNIAHKIFKFCEIISHPLHKS